MKKIILGLFLEILVISIISNAIVINDIGTNSPDMGYKSLYWIYNDNKECGQITILSYKF